MSHTLKTMKALATMAWQEAMKMPVKHDRWVKGRGDKPKRQRGDADDNDKLRKASNGSELLIDGEYNDIVVAEDLADMVTYKWFCERQNTTVDDFVSDLVFGNTICSGDVRAIIRIIEHEFNREQRSKKWDRTPSPSPPPSSLTSSPEPQSSTSTLRNSHSDHTRNAHDRPSGLSTVSKATKATFGSSATVPVVPAVLTISSVSTTPTGVVASTPRQDQNVHNGSPVALSTSTSPISTKQARDNLLNAVEEDWKGLWESHADHGRWIDEDGTPVRHLPSTHDKDNVLKKNNQWSLVLHSKTLQIVTAQDLPRKVLGSWLAYRAWKNATKRTFLDNFVNAHACYRPDVDILWRIIEKHLESSGVLALEEEARSLLDFSLSAPPTTSSATPNSTSASQGPPSAVTNNGQSRDQGLSSAAPRSTSASQPPPSVLPGKRKKSGEGLSSIGVRSPPNGDEASTKRQKQDHSDTGPTPSRADAFKHQSSSNLDVDEENESPDAIPSSTVEEHAYKSYLTSTRKPPKPAKISTASIERANALSTSSAGETTSVAKPDTYGSSDFTSGRTINNRESKSNIAPPPKRKRPVGRMEKPDYEPWITQKQHDQGYWMTGWGQDPNGDWNYAIGITNEQGVDEITEYIYGSHTHVGYRANARITHEPYKRREYAYDPSYF